MPVKRRLAKRRIDPAAELAAWAGTFETGHDFFDELRDLGVTAHHERFVDRETRDQQRAELHELTRAAWHRLGRTYLNNQSGEPVECWALDTFGEPQCR